MIRAAHTRSRACGSRVKNVIIAGSCLALTASGCAFEGLNSLPLPGAVGRGPDAVKYHVEIPNVSTMESNSPVMINDVVVGSVGMRGRRQFLLGNVPNRVSHGAGCTVVIVNTADAA